MDMQILSFEVSLKKQRVIVNSVYLHMKLMIKEYMKEVLTHSTLMLDNMIPQKFGVRFVLVEELKFLM